MDISNILEQLKQDYRQLGAAITALENLKGKQGKRPAGKRTMSASARRRIAKAQRARWKVWHAKRRAK